MIKVIIKIDLEDNVTYTIIATKDPIYPEPKDYGYKSIISGRTYKVWA